VSGPVKDAWQKFIARPTEENRDALNRAISQSPVFWSWVLGAASVVIIYFAFVY